MNLIDGKKIATEILEKVKNDVTTLSIKPKLAVILATNDASSHKYVELKRVKAESVGIQTEVYSYKEDVTKGKLIDDIKRLNEDENVNGILIQLPLYTHLHDETLEIVNAVDPTKDVDGLTALQQGLVGQQFPNALLPATVDAVMECLKYTRLSVTPSGFTTSPFVKGGVSRSDEGVMGKNIVIINNSILIGKPLASILSSYDATVTIANKFTQDLIDLTRNADILVSATGQTQIIDHNMIKRGAILIDVTSELRRDKVLGDVIVTLKLKAKASWLTPVPGGVGPITIACLLRNVVKATNFQ